MEHCARRMLERKVDGVAIMTFGIEEFLLDRFSAEDIPIVFIDAAPSRPRQQPLRWTTAPASTRACSISPCSAIARSPSSAVRSAAGPPKAPRGRLPRLPASTGLKANPAWIIEGDHTLDGGRDAMQKILALPDWPTAVMCSNDMTAIGVQHALFEANLSVPDDFSLIGFDDIHLAEYTIPPLTTVRMSCKELAPRPSTTSSRTCSRPRGARQPRRGPVSTPVSSFARPPACPGTRSTTSPRDAPPPPPANADSSCSGLWSVAFALAFLSVIPSGNLLLPLPLAIALAIALAFAVAVARFDRISRALQPPDTAAPRRWALALASTPWLPHS